MTETDSVRLARMEEKLDAWMDRTDERHANTCKDVAALQSDVGGLKEDRARMVGLGMAGGAILAWLGNVAIKIFTASK